jgi:hypothetical protein
VGAHLGGGYRPNVLQNLVFDIITGSIVHPSKREIRFFQRGTHHLLVVHNLKAAVLSIVYFKAWAITKRKRKAQFINLFKNHTNAHSQCISFLFKELVSRICTL